MAAQQSSFNKNAERVAFDQEHRKRINFNIGRYDTAVIKGKQIFSNLELARQRAASIKYKSIYGIDKLLTEFETNFTRNGGKVIWAIDDNAALEIIIQLFEQHKVSKVVKSKSMTTEEIDLNKALAEINVDVVETDLGEYIVQLADEKPYHIVTPAMHKSKEDVAALFHEKFGLETTARPDEITAFVRKKLKHEFIEAQAGITGANFLLADIGAVALTENEGNGLLSMAFPELHIVLAGIEKIIPSIDDLDLFWPLLATFGTGQCLTAYNSIVSGPRKEGEQTGPKQMVVILIDNGRTNLLAKTRQRVALGCIRCGACLNVCPVYKNIGGHSYETTYSGPIGSVITPHMRGMKAYNHLSFASTLCGQCTEVCPVKIPLHELLILNRNDAVKEGFTTSADRFMMKTSRKLMLNRKLMNIAGSGTKNAVMKYFAASGWGDRREMPKFAPKPFCKLWKEDEEQIKARSKQKPPKKKE
jgi:L-lactate dehydrogenase complex protein LldF